MKVVLSVEALAPDLTGIGRYTWELAQRLPHSPQVERVRFYRNGRWVTDPQSLLQTAAPPALLPTSPPAKASRPRLKLPRAVRDWGVRLACRGSVFHGPNFFCQLGRVTAL